MDELFEMLNAAPEMISGLAELVRETAKEEAWIK